MKTLKTLVIALTAVGMVAACSQVGNVTKLTGTVGEDFDEVNVAVDKYDIDTLVPVVNGKFQIDLPVDPTEIAFVSAGYYTGYFILDGTRLTMELGEETVVTSKSRKSLQNRYNEFEDKIVEMADDFQAQVTAIMSAEESATEDNTVRYEEIYDAATNAIAAYVEEVIFENRDNAIAGIAVNKLNGAVEDESLLTLLDTLSVEMQESLFVTPLREELETRLSTAEGMPFKDFTVEDSDGKTVSLSDYVGRGKYVLVDFWASWCEPCKDEVPYIRNAYDKYHRKGLDVVSVAVADDPEDSKSTAKELGMNWNLIINAGQLPAEVYGFTTIPQIMLVGPDGTILKKGLRGEEISEEIGKYIQ